MSFLAQCNFVPYRQVIKSQYFTALNIHIKEVTFQGNEEVKGVFLPNLDQTNYSMAATTVHNIVVLLSEQTTGHCKNDELTKCHYKQLHNAEVTVSWYH